MDRGKGKRNGHWNGENSQNRYREDGTHLPGNKSNNSIYPKKIFHH